jgi:hypothetical protein
MDATIEIGVCFYVKFINTHIYGAAMVNQMRERNEEAGI